jgi:hypothetical protein
MRLTGSWGFRLAPKARQNQFNANKAASAKLSANTATLFANGRLNELVAEEAHLT